MLSSKTKLVALVAVSNMLGCILDTSYVAEQAHRVRASASAQHLFTEISLNGACLRTFHICARLCILIDW